MCLDGLDEYRGGANKSNISDAKQTNDLVWKIAQLDTGQVGVGYFST